jgi:hypothetical protein
MTNLYIIPPHCGCNIISILSCLLPLCTIGWSLSKITSQLAWIKVTEIFVSKFFYFHWIVNPDEIVDGTECWGNLGLG